MIKYLDAILKQDFSAFVQAMSEDEGEIVDPNADDFEYPDDNDQYDDSLPLNQFTYDITDKGDIDIYALVDPTVVLTIDHDDLDFKTSLMQWEQDYGREYFDDFLYSMADEYDFSELGIVVSEATLNEYTMKWKVNWRGKKRRKVVCKPGWKFDGSKCVIIPRKEKLKRIRGQRLRKRTLAAKGEGFQRRTIKRAAIANKKREGMGFE